MLRVSARRRSPFQLKNATFGCLNKNFLDYRVCFSSAGQQKHQHDFLSSEIYERIHKLPLASTFDPEKVEKGWQNIWQEIDRKKKKEEANVSKEKFTMILPPPNVTGALHIGHALTITIQDALVRWHQMRGFDVQWIPGLDHAGIATQSVVERKLMKEKEQTRHELGRDAFEAEVWKWNDQYGGRILDQVDQLGALVDKDEFYFTLDVKRSKAVIDAFVELYEKGLMYRKRRMVNWCPTLQTAISDIEVDTEALDGPTKKLLPGRTKPVEFGVMHRILYKVQGMDEYLEVDTTRPETIFGDTAVAIHPEDSRFARFHGKKVVHPFTGEYLPIVLDEVLVNPELGTGVVKVTPAHDARDYECSQRHALPEKEVIDRLGRMCGDIPPDFVGMDRFDARAKVLEEMERKRLYVGRTDHSTSLSICSRSGNVIEPLLMPQWFVDCRAMAAKAASNVRENKILIEPAQHHHTWFYFLDNIQDWCVSRQLWWGHRIPAYRIQKTGEWIVARSLEEAIKKAGPEVQASDLEQDEDVLDTWFSSALLPLSALGWPDTLKRQRYPLSVMETGSDILFFWVARMAMLCEELHGHLPFQKVLLHPMVRDKAGRKMSKSLGNVIDPLHVIHGITLDELLQRLANGNIDPRELKKAEKELRREFPKGIPTCGADALRFTMASYLQQGRQINMDVQRVVSYRHFCNKIWNAVRYALPLLESSREIQREEALQDAENFSLADKWILSRLAQAIVKCNAGLESNHLALSVLAMQNFFVQELCDVYIEFSKPILYGNRIETSKTELQKQQRCSQAVLHLCLDYSMRLLHPFMPFVTEELWQRIRCNGPVSSSTEAATSILTVKYPEPNAVRHWIDEDVEKNMRVVLDVMHAIRSLKHSQKTLAPNEINLSKMEIVCTDPELRNQLEKSLNDIEIQCRVSNVRLLDAHPNAAKGALLTQSISDSCKVHIEIPANQDTFDRVASEMSRLGKRASKSRKALEALFERRKEPSYTTKVPETVQSQDEMRLNQLETELLATETSLRALHQLQLQYEQD